MSPRELLPLADGYHDRDAKGRHQFMVSVTGARPGEIVNSSALAVNHTMVNSVPVSHKSREGTANEAEGASAYKDTNIETALVTVKDTTPAYKHKGFNMTQSDFAHAEATDSIVS